MSRVELRSLAVEDRDRLRRWRNSPEVARWMYTDHEIGPEEHAAWFERVLADGGATCRYWIIEVDGLPAGIACLTGIDQRHQRCSFGLYLGEPVTGSGIGRAALVRLFDAALLELGLNKVCGEALATNERAIRLYERVEMVREGILRRHVRKGDAFVDVVQFAMLKDEWLARRPIHPAL